jgi:hypothetical protein
MISIEDIPKRSLFKIKDVAKMFSVSETNVRAWIRFGRIENEKIIGIVRIPYFAVVNFIKADGKQNVFNKEISHNKIRQNLSGRIQLALKSKKNIKTMKYLGCSFEEFLNHIEKQFKPGMTWDNYGRGGWHVDHIIPCNSFDLTQLQHRLACFHFSNLQPLWESENIQKGDKVNRKTLNKYYENAENTQTL